ncbi:hypothetical protein ASE41_20170 [Streptomyces sp. Root264]|nr:hypothetical protein ASE41_20170 [Streptomyces sp. Root264]
MYEQNNTPPPKQSAAQQDAIDVNDFVFAATGARVRRLTTPDGTHWFPAVDVCKNLGYAHIGSTLRNIAVAAVLAPALVRGEARYRVEEIASPTGLPLDRVHDCLRCCSSGRVCGRPAVPPTERRSTYCRSRPVT